LVTRFIFIFHNFLYTHAFIENYRWRSDDIDVDPVNIEMCKHDLTLISGYCPPSIAVCFDCLIILHIHLIIF